MLSVLVFFSISFITVLLQLNLPLHRQTDGVLDIGFPMTYYSQFVVDSFLHTGWNMTSLLVDCLLTWLITVSIYGVRWKNKPEMKPN